MLPLFNPCIINLDASINKSDQTSYPLTPEVLKFKCTKPQNFKFGNTVLDAPYLVLCCSLLRALRGATALSCIGIVTIADHLEEKLKRSAS